MPTMVTFDRWFRTAKEKGATHIVVMRDTFDYEDYPIYVMPGQDPRAIAAEAGNKDMQRVMEVYNMSMPVGPQLAEHRAFNY